MKGILTVETGFVVLPVVDGLSNILKVSALNHILVCHVGVDDVA